MDGAKPRKSDAAATRKRRSSILKSQRSVRAPLSELEFYVATPDQAKSRRVSFSRRTGVAEFEINEATTAWKNVYEEHNKSLESSANESGIKSAPRRVAHLGGRGRGRASHFEDAEADELEDALDALDAPAPIQRRSALDEPTNIDTLQFFQLDANPGPREPTDTLDVDFSAVTPLVLADDLDLLRQDLAREPSRDNIHEVSIDVDFNATHFSLKADDDDMSITYTIRNAVATEKSQLDFSVAATKKSQDYWTADKENIVVNPYIAPPPAEFPCEDDILVFDGKMCKFQSKVDLEASSKSTENPVVRAETRASQHETEELRGSRSVFEDGDMSVTQAVAADIIVPGVQDKENEKTVYFNDLADMSVTQAIPANIIHYEPQTSTTIYGDNGHISMTEAVPGALLGPSASLGLQANLDDMRRRTTILQNDVSNLNACLDVNGALPGRRRTIIYGNDGNISMTGVVPANIIEVNEKKLDHRTIVFGNDGNISMTGVVPANIIEVNAQRNLDHKTIVYGNDGNMSITGVVTDNLIDKAEVSQQLNTDRRRTVLFGNEGGDLSMTGVAPVNIVGGVKAQEGNSDRRRTVVYNDDDGNVSMTGVVTANIINEAKENQQPNIDRRKTIVYNDDDGNVSMTGVVPANVIDQQAVNQQPNIDRRRTIVYNDDDGNVSMTGVVTANISEPVTVSQQPNIDRGRTVVYGKDDGNVSMTGVVPANIIDQAPVSQQPNIDRRKTVVYNDDDGNVSMTGVVPANIIDEAKENQQPNSDRRRTIVYDDDDGNVSMTGVVPANIIDQVPVSQQPNIDRRKTIVFNDDDGNVSMTGVVPANISEPVTVSQHPNSDRRRTVLYGTDDENVSMTGVVPTNIIDDRKENRQSNMDRRTIVSGNDDANSMSITGVAPVNILGDLKVAQEPLLNCRETILSGSDDANVSIIGVVANNIEEAKSGQNIDRRNTVFGNDNYNVSVTGMVPVNILVAKEPTTDSRKSKGFDTDEGNVPPTNIQNGNVDEKPIDDRDNGKLSTAAPKRDGTKTVNENDDKKVSTTSVASELFEDANENIQEELNTERRKTVVFDDGDGNMSVTETVPDNIQVNENVQLITESRRKTVVYEDENVSMTGVVPANEVKHPNTDVNAIGNEPENIPDKEHDRVNIAPLNIYLSKECKRIEIEALPPIENARLIQSPIDTVCEDNDVSMTGSPAKITGHTDVVVPETLTSIIYENTEKYQQKELEMDEKDQVEMLAAVIMPQLLESDEDADMSMSEVNVYALSTNPCSATFNKSMAGKSTIYNQSLAGQECASTANKSLANQTFDKSIVDPRSATINKNFADQTCSAEFDKSANQVCSTTFNKSSAGQVLSTTYTKLDGQMSTLDKSLAGVGSATFNKTLAGQECSTNDKSRNPSSKSMNKSSNQVLVYGATTTSSASIYLESEDFNPEVAKSQESPDNPLPVLSSTSLAHSLPLKSPIPSDSSTTVLDKLLDMSHASLEDISNEPRSNTQTICNTAPNSIPTSQSYILVKDDEETQQDPELSTAETTEALVVGKKHGIVCKLQHKLSEFKDMLHVKDKTKKDQKTSIENTDVTQNSTKNTEKTPMKSAVRKSTSPSDKNKSVKIDLTTRMRLDYQEYPLQQTNEAHMNLTSGINENEDQLQANATNCQANDTRAILDALSDFTDTRRSGDFEPVPSPEKTRRTSAPDRKSMVISREDLFREISMANELLKTEMQQTEDMDVSSDEHEPSPPRVSEVVKTLRFEDEESILEPKILHKPLSAQPSPRRLSTVIPTYEISDPVKELVNDLIKPLADVEQTAYKGKSSNCSQADLCDSSQIDLTPSRPVLISPRSCLRQTEHVKMRKSEAKEIIYFDHLNPLNNILLPAVDEVLVHKYDPRRSEESIASIAPSMDSTSCQTEMAGCDVEVGMVLLSPKVDRAISSEKTLIDTEVNTSITMKANRDLLAGCSSLTLVDEALGRHERRVEIDRPSRSPVRVIFKLEEAHSSVQLGSELTSDVSSEMMRKKRAHPPAAGTVTPKPAIKLQKVSTSDRVSRKQRGDASSEKDSSVSSRGSSVTVALYACARSASATESWSSKVSEWMPELLHEPSSKNLVSEQEPGVNVVAKIDVLPFMGTPECEWESRAGDTWSFRLLRARVRLLVHLQHRATNNTRATVRADTPVRLVAVQNAAQDRDNADPVAALCVCLATEALQKLCDRGVTRAGQVPALLRRCAAVARVALRWGRAMRATRVELAFSLSDDGCISLKVANIPLRSVWEVTFRVELAPAGHPQAAGVCVAPVVASWSPGRHQLADLLRPLPQDWGHVPRAVWLIFKYLKNKRPDDDDLFAT